MKDITLTAEKGFTLIEMLVAMVVIGTLAAVIIGLNGGMFTRYTEINNLQTGTEILQGCAEKILTARRFSTDRFNTTFSSSFCNELSNAGLTPSVVTTVITTSMNPSSSCPIGETCKVTTISVQRLGVDISYPMTLQLIDY